MARRIVVPRLEGAETPAHVASPLGRMVDPPEVMSIRLALGVGPTADATATDETFRTTYHVEIPVFSLGGLDPDGVYEFDGARLFDMVRQRSLRRQWAARLELVLQQSAESDTLADIYVDTPFDEHDSSGPTMHVLGKTGRGLLLPGGGRSVVLATSLVHHPKMVPRLGGIYSMQLRDIDPATRGKPGVASLSRGINIDLTRFEFEG